MKSKTLTKNKYILIDVTKLKPNESTIPERIWDLVLDILEERKWKKPICVHESSFAIMDGHHRHQAALLLGLNKVPCLLFNYGSEAKVSSTNRQKVTPHDIIQRSQSENLYPYKTTCHEFFSKIPRLNLNISELS